MSCFLLRTENNNNTCPCLQFIFDPGQLPFQFFGFCSIILFFGHVSLFRIPQLFNSFIKVINLMARSSPISILLRFQCAHLLFIANRNISVEATSLFFFRKDSQKLQQYHNLSQRLNENVQRPNNTFSMLIGCIRFITLPWGHIGFNLFLLETYDCG